MLDLAAILLVSSALGAEPCSAEAPQGCAAAVAAAPDADDAWRWRLWGCATGDGDVCVDAHDRGMRGAPLAVGTRRACLEHGHARACAIAREHGWVQDGLSGLSWHDFVGQPYFTASGAAWGDHHWSRGWRLDGGELQGLPDPRTRQGRRRRRDGDRLEVFWVEGHAFLDREKVVLLSEDALWWPRLEQVRWIPDACGPKALSRDGEVLVHGILDERGSCRGLRWRATRTLEPTAEVWLPLEVRSLALDGDGDRTAVALREGTVQVLEGDLVLAELAHPEPSLPPPAQSGMGYRQHPPAHLPVDLAWSADGEHLASAWVRSPLQIWTGAGWTPLDAQVAAVTWSLDHRLASVGDAVHLHAADGARLLRPVHLARGSGMDLSKVELSPDGARVLATQGWGSTWLLELEGAPGAPPVTDLDRAQVSNHLGDSYTARADLPPPPPRHVPGQLVLPSGEEPEGVRLVLTWSKRYDEPPPAERRLEVVTGEDGWFLTPPLHDGYWSLQAEGHDHPCVTFKPDHHPIGCGGSLAWSASPPEEPVWVSEVPRGPLPGVMLRFPEGVRPWRVLLGEGEDLVRCEQLGSRALCRNAETGGQTLRLTLDHQHSVDLLVDVTAGEVLDVDLQR